jgi:hypothetical protein
MLNRIAISLSLLLLSGGGLTQELDLSHPLFQAEIKTWDYGMLMECSVKYETAVGVYKSLAKDPTHFAEAIARWEDAQSLFYYLARSSALAQGLSEEDVASLHGARNRQLMEPINTAGSENKKALADIAVQYMNDAKIICAPYFEELTARMETVERRISKKR